MVADHSFSFFKLASFTFAHAPVRRIQHKSITKIGEYSWKTFFFSLAAVWAERSEHFQFSFDFDLGYISDHFLASYNCTVPSFLM